MDFVLVLDVCILIFLASWYTDYDTEVTFSCDHMYAIKHAEYSVIIAINNLKQTGLNE